MTNPSLDLEELKRLVTEYETERRARPKVIWHTTGELLRSVPALIAEVERLREERNLRTLLDAESEVAEKTFNKVSLPDFSHD